MSEKGFSITTRNARLQVRSHMKQGHNTHGSSVIIFVREEKTLKIEGGHVECIHLGLHEFSPKSVMIAIFSYTDKSYWLWIFDAQL